MKHGKPAFSGRAAAALLCCCALFWAGPCGAMGSSEPRAAASAPAKAAPPEKAPAQEKTAPQPEAAASPEPAPASRQPQVSENYAPGYQGFAGTWRDPENGDIVTSVIAPRQPAGQGAYNGPIVIEPQVYPDSSWNGGWSNGANAGSQWSGPALPPPAPWAGQQPPPPPPGSNGPSAGQNWSGPGPWGAPGPPPGSNGRPPLPPPPGPGAGQPGAPGWNNGVRPGAPGGNGAWAPPGQNLNGPGPWAPSGSQPAPNVRPTVPPAQPGQPGQWGTGPGSPSAPAWNNGLGPGPAGGNPPPPAPGQIWRPSGYDGTAGRPPAWGAPRPGAHWHGHGSPQYAGFRQFRQVQARGHARSHAGAWR